ncbi:LamG-like jellyroll fold domain-containing protein [Geminisphaera colitermitum]|uniref:LamG-like jellyroll fold domain-containing protein n=1 Tax=Geminisphaera colitermitum TaxID=1148786 RepID=UPI0005B939ED|nr:LamG-like jellyroll fold domain-containing protein [Geminisphaera colitermitum]
MKIPAILMAACIGISMQITCVSGANDSPVIFWAHYMPMVPHGHMHAHPHAAGNHDAWPFDSQHSASKDDYKEDMLQALESGINGFQMLGSVNPAMFDAAREIHAATGRLFYIAPQWLYPRDFDKNIAAIEIFARTYAGNPHVYTLGGRQVHFFWESVNDDLLAKIRDAFLARGIDIALVPTLRGLTPSSLSDTTLPAIEWTAAQGWSHGALDPAQAAALVARLRQHAPKNFLYIPAIAAGYDSSNRTGQAIHVPFHGIATLRDNLKTWVGLGIRQTMLVTWNDPQESLEIPSSRNIWGHNTLLRYYHEIAATGRSPFATPQPIVSYPVECIQGDDLFFQIVGIPSTDTDIVWRARIALHPILPTTTPLPPPPFILTADLPAPGKNKDAFLNLAWNTRPALDLAASALQPRITIECRPADAAPHAPWQTLHRDLTLPPVTLRYNLVQYPVPYAIQLSRIAPNDTLTLDIRPAAGIPGNALSTATVTAATPAPMRRLILNDGTRSLGTFRDAEPAAPDQLRNLYVRIEASDPLPLSLRINKGALHDLYSPYGKLDQAVQPLNAAMATFPARPAGGEYRMRVVRLTATPDATLTLNYAQHPDTTALTATLDQLARGTLTRAATLDGRELTLGMTLTTDATDPNIDYPLPPRSTAIRTLPLHPSREGERVLHAMALLADDTVAISPAIIIGDPAPEAIQHVTTQWIQTSGTFSDFVLGTSESSLNPFTSDQVRTTPLRRRAIPYFNLNFSETAGLRLNDTGASQQAGRGWIEIGKAKRDDAISGPRPTDPASRYRWLPASEGRIGSALQLGPDTGIRFRSKSSPVGPQTLALWVDLAFPSPPPPADTAAPNPAATLHAGPFQLEFLPPKASTPDAPNTAHLRFNRSGQHYEHPFPLPPLSPGWHHLAFVYDLAAVRLYIDGRAAAEIDGVRPLYQRTHQSPLVRFQPAPSGTSAPAIGFTGKLDELQVIGTGLPSVDIAPLAAGHPWRQLTD